VLRELSDIERGSLRDLLAHPTPLRSAIEKFSSARKQAMDSSAAECLRTLPRQFEEAADYAAKAEVYLQFLKDLERFAEK
jgi:hypothetical protein